MPSRPNFATFWARGRLSAYESACLATFVKHGYAMTVFSYGDVERLPSGVVLKSASELVDEKFVDAYLIKGRPSLSHFSDLFRYRLFQETDSVWVDSDMYLLRPFDFDLPDTILAREDSTMLCGALMRLSSANPALGRLVAATEAVAGRNIVWGETGPRLLTRILGPEIMEHTYGPEKFFPVHYDDFWKVYLPEHYDECVESCRAGYTLHLWNNIVTKVGVWKDVLPPEGSYLEKLFVNDGLADLFVGRFPAPVMRHVIDNYRMRISGNFNDVAKLARLAIPGIRRRTIRQLDRMRDRIAGRS